MANASKSKHYNKVQAMCQTPNNGRLLTKHLQI